MVGTDRIATPRPRVRRNCLRELAHSPA
jgi:hypothetical protein